AGVERRSSYNDPVGARLDDANRPAARGVPMSLTFARTLRVVHVLVGRHGHWKGDRGRVGRILIAGQMGIGNMVMFTPFLRALRAGFPGAHIAMAFWKRNGADEVVAGSPWV